MHTAYVARIQKHFEKFEFLMKSRSSLSRPPSRLKNQIKAARGDAFWESGGVERCTKNVDERYNYNFTRNGNFWVLSGRFFKEFCKF